MDIHNKVVLVTGASRGIGLAIATELSDKGAIVIGTATSIEGASNISKTLSSKDKKGGAAASISSIIETMNNKMDIIVDRISSCSTTIRGGVKKEEDDYIYYSIVM